MTELIDYEYSFHPLSDRPSGDQPQQEVPLGSQFRQAIAEQEAAERERVQDGQKRRNKEAERNLSEWFNNLARDLPGRVRALLTRVKNGEKVEAAIVDRMEFSAETIPFLSQLEIDKLPAFENLENTSRKLEVNLQVEHSSKSPSRVRGDGRPYNTIEVKINPRVRFVPFNGVKRNHFS